QRFLMSTLDTSIATPSRRSPVSRILRWLAVLLVVILVSLVGGAYWIARSALPHLDGSTQVQGIYAPVTVARDADGVPVLYAGTLEDLFFAQGYVTAQDRLWQMDILRRVSGGELSEILGERTLKMDREQRILGLRASARKSLETITPRDR